MRLFHLDGEKLAWLMDIRSRNQTWLVLIIGRLMVCWERVGRP